jgi:hypothetical protein
MNVGPLSNNVVRRAALFSVYVDPKAPMLSGQTVYFLGPHVRIDDEKCSDLFVIL